MNKAYLPVVALLVVVPMPIALHTLGSPDRNATGSIAEACRAAGRNASVALSR
jgi:ABC-type Fe3+ transport system permease subunit